MTLVIVQSASSFTPANVRTLMRSLQTAMVTNDEINAKLDRFSISVSDAVVEVLREWRSRMSDDATLGSLVLHLKDCDFVSHADALQQKYMRNKPEGESSEISVHEDNLQINTPNPRDNNSTNQFNAAQQNSAQVNSTSSPSEADANSPLLLPACGNNQQNITELSDDISDDQNTPTQYGKRLSDRKIQSSPRLFEQLKQKIKNNLIITIFVAIAVVLAILLSYFSISTIKNTQDQKSSRNKAEKVTTLNS